jgi:hypothetical protein
MIATTRAVTGLVTFLIAADLAVRPPGADWRPAVVVLPPAEATDTRSRGVEEIWRTPPGVRP